MPDFNHIGSEIFGLPIQQSWSDLAAWSEFLKVCKYDRIIELGAGSGVFSYWIYMHAVTRKSEFCSYEKPVDQRKIAACIDNKIVVEFACDTVIESDIWIPTSQTKIREFLQKDGVSIAYCDNGKKRK